MIRNNEVSAVEVWFLKNTVKALTKDELKKIKHAKKRHDR